MNMPNSYIGEITAQITDNAIRFQSKMEGQVLSQWGFTKEDVEDALNELQAYRDTGLTPEEIKDYEEMFTAYRHICGGKSPEEIEQIISDRDYWKAEALKWCSKLGDMKEAEEQGMLVDLYKQFSTEEVKHIFHVLMEDCCGVPIPRETTDYVVDDLMR